MEEYNPLWDSQYVVFIQQLGRGLRKADGKEFVVILDFIGNYEKNFMIPIALSGDRTYNPDTIRKYVISGNSTIPGASTVHFDAVAKEKIFRSIDKIRGIKAIIKDSYISLKNRLGRVPYLMDFYENGEITSITQSGAPLHPFSDIFVLSHMTEISGSIHVLSLASRLTAKGAGGCECKIW